nr:alpha/beta hydrolase [Sphingomicrobium lutaoense]
MHYRDYAGPMDGPPIICMPGLTRNARDFEPVADRFAGEWRVIAVEFRGRGLSGWDPDPERYDPPTYAADILKLLDQLGLADAVFVGTSLGGIVTMLLSATDGERIAGALINDIAPELHEPGIERIRGYVGKQPIYESYAVAAAALKERIGDIYPRWDLAQWEVFARRLMREVKGGVQFDYDPRIADNVLKSSEASMDAWHLLGGLAEIPVTILRGELSDLFTEEMAQRMLKELPRAKLATIPDVGHAPSFDEPESLAALEELLKRVRAAQ